MTANPHSANPGNPKQTKKTSGAPYIFIEESGKSAITILWNTTANKAVLHLSPSDRVVLSRNKNTVIVRTLEGDLLGHLEPKLGNRISRLIGGGNKYTAAVVMVNGQEVSVLIRETFKHRSLQNVCSFPSKAKEEGRVFLNETVARFMREEDDSDDDENHEENIIVFHEKNHAAIRG